MIPRSNVLGVGISALNLRQAATMICESSKSPGFQGYVTVTGVHGVMESQHDPKLRDIHNQSFLSVPDGMPMVWIGHWNGFTGMSRVYGPSLMLDVMAQSTADGLKHYLFGGADGVVELLSDRLRMRHDNIQIVGKSTPPFRPLTEQEESKLVDDLQACRPHFFWVGLSTPKQERFMHDFLAKHPNLTADWDHGLVMLGVGAAFDFHAGLVRQAPAWMQQSGLEWFFRLCVEPKRLWKRYLYNNPRFLWRIFLQLSGLRSIPLGDQGK